MAHGRDKQGREKRKPKKDKASGVKPREGSEVIDHVQGHGVPAVERKPEGKS
jgi:hypothetical protein